jgi:hypothetical protein
MTPADEQHFIQLWHEGASQQEIAASLRVPLGTVKSRASALARQGKIQARPRGGAYPMQRHQAALAGVSNRVSRDRLPGSNREIFGVKVLRLTIQGVVSSLTK